MSDEIEKKETWEDRQKRISVEVTEALGGETPESVLQGREEQKALMEEFFSLAHWFTDAYDREMLAGIGNGFNSTEAATRARMLVKEADPERFNRYREVEKQLQMANLDAQTVAKSAHVSVIEANLRTRSW